MKPLYVLLIGISLVGVVYLLFFTTPDAVTNYPSDGSTVVAFGASLVVGVGSTEGNDFVSLLSQQLDEPIINLGQSGETTEVAMRRIDEVLDQDPKVVLLLLGGNDILQRKPRTETFANLAQMIETIQASGASVLLLGVRGGVLTDSYEKEYRRLARTYNTAYVPDVLDGLFGNPALMSDTIHPNDAGYQIIADRIQPVLQPLVAK